MDCSLKDRIASGPWANRSRIDAEEEYEEEG
jgi:hypothetical protein